MNKSAIDSLHNGKTVYIELAITNFLLNVEKVVIKIIKKYGMIYVFTIFVLFMLPTLMGISSGVHEYYIKILQRLFAYVNKLIAEKNNIPIPSILKTIYLKKVKKKKMIL